MLVMLCFRLLLSPQQSKGTVAVGNCPYIRVLCHVVCSSHTCYEVWSDGEVVLLKDLQHCPEISAVSVTEQLNGSLAMALANTALLCILVTVGLWNQPARLRLQG